MDYQAPELETYGSVTDLTGVIGPSSEADVNRNTGAEGTGSFNVTHND